MKKDFVSLAEARPDLAKEWNYEKNGDLRPEDVSCGSGKKVWWKLPYDDHNTGKHFDFEWQAEINSRNAGKGCPYLKGKAVWPGFNDLLTINPELAAQWHPTKNGNLKPTQVTASSGYKVWWLLPYNDPNTGKHFDFEWQDTIAHRNDGRKCPYLSGKIVFPGFNDLHTINPKLAKQWHPTKNGDLNPVQITAGSDKKAWWQLSYDDPNTGRHFDFEWQAKIYSRNEGAGCPYLTAYKGEEYIKQYLKKNNIFLMYNKSLRICSVLVMVNYHMTFQYLMKKSMDIF